MPGFCPIIKNPPGLTRDPGTRALTGITLSFQYVLSVRDADHWIWITRDSRPRRRLLYGKELPNGTLTVATLDRLQDAAKQPTKGIAAESQAQEVTFTNGKGTITFPFDGNFAGDFLVVVFNKRLEIFNVHPLRLQPITLSGSDELIGLYDPNQGAAIDDTSVTLTQSGSTVTAAIHYGESGEEDEVTLFEVDPGTDPLVIDPSGAQETVGGEAAFTVSHPSGSTAGRKVQAETSIGRASAVLTLE
jgi:hypothetical protein